MRQAENTLRGRAGSFVGPLYTAIVSRVLCTQSHVSTLRLVQLHANLLHAPFKRYLDHNWGICLEPRSGSSHLELQTRLRKRAVP